MSGLSRAKRRKLRYGPGGTVRYRIGGVVGITSAEQARMYVEAGRADWAEDGVLDFKPFDHRCIAAAKSASRPQFTDGIGMATIEAIRGLPCIQPEKLLECR